MKKRESDMQTCSSCRLAVALYSVPLVATSREVREGKGRRKNKDKHTHTHRHVST